MAGDLKAVTLDPNVWYQLTEARVDEYNDGNFTSMLQIQDDGSLGVWAADKTDYFQFQPVDDTDGRYAVRCSSTSLKKQLSVCRNPDEGDSSKTQPCMDTSSGGDEQKWDVAAWTDEDKTYRFINVKNGSDYYMDVHPGNPPFMSNNIDSGAFQPAQHWLMSSVRNVDDGAYSTVFTNAPKSTSTNTMTSDAPSPTSTNDSSSPDFSDPSTDSSSSGLSTGAAAGIGVGVGAVVIALVFALFFLWRRRRNAKPTAHLTNHTAAEMAAGYGPPDKFSPSQSYSPYSGYQSASTPPQQNYGVVHEAPANHFTSELDSTQVPRSDTTSPR